MILTISNFVVANQASMSIESFFSYYQEELIGLSKLNSISELNDEGRNLLNNFYYNHYDQIEAITLVDAKGIIKYTFLMKKIQLVRTY